MDSKFWLDRWQEDKIGFHQGETNKLLMKHWPRLCPDTSSTAEVFVPLCGKSLDMVWLSNEGYEHHVIGVELSRLAIEQFYTYQIDDAPKPQRQGDHDVYLWGRWELWCGDFFSFPTERLKNTKLAYDRASLIALPPEMRQRYADKLCELLPADARMLLLTITYNPGEMDGPPFPVSNNEVHALFGTRRHIEHIETRDGLAGAKDLQDRGLTALDISVFIIGEALT